MDVYARGPELARLRARTPRSPGSGSLVVVGGPAGVGKSALLRTAGVAWRKAGAVVLAPDPASPVPLDGLLTVVREHFEDVGSRVVGDALATIVRLRGEGAPAVVLRSALRVLFRHLTEKRPIVLVLDPPTDFAGSFVVEVARREGCLVVATECPGVPVTASIELISTLADEVIDLPDLSHEDIETVVTRVLGSRLDDRLMPAVRSSLGPLAGNPGAVLGVVRALRAAGRLRTVMRHVCLVGVDRPVPLHPGHPLLARVSELGPTAERILALVAATGPLSVHDLTRRRGGDPDRDGRVVDDMVAAGLLVAYRDGTVACAFPALAAAAVDRFGTAGTGPVSSDPARDGGGADDPDDWPVSRFLRSLPKPGPRAVAPVGPRVAAEHIDPVPAGLAEDDPRLRAVLAEALRDGRFAFLGRVAAAYSQSTRRGAAVHGDLAAAAMLAALHLGRPTPAGVAARLYTGASGAGPAAFERWWFGAGVHHETPPPTSAARDHAEPGDPLLAREELDLTALAMGGDLPGCRAGMSELRPTATADVGVLVDRGLWGDLASVFRIVLGSRYGEPSAGPLAVYRRAAVDFAAARWPESLSACRELEVVARTPTQLHHRARLLAAEICGAGGDLRQAAEWLDAASDAVAFGPMRTWARHSRVVVERGLAGALESVVAELERCATGPLTEGTRIGLSLMLGRGIELAVELGEREIAEHLLAQLEGMAQDRALTAGEDHVLYAQAMVRQDLSRATACAERARARQVPVRLAKACVVAARLDSDPRPWLHEAYHITGGLRAGALRAGVLRAMRELGVTRPRAQPARPTFSDTELRIVELLRGGWTNRQIATDVQLTEKTVESYLTRLFTKTGCRTRVELAAASLAGRFPTGTN